MLRYLSLSLAIGVVAVAGCGPALDLFFPPEPADEQTDVPELRSFESEQELQDYFQGEIRSRNDQAVSSMDGVIEEELPLGRAAPGGAVTSESLDADDAAPGAPPAAAPNSGAVQDGAIDLAADPEHSDTTIQEEGVDEADVVKTDGTHLYIINGQTLRIVRVWPPEEMATLSEVELEGAGREIYLYDDKIVALTDISAYQYYGDVPIMMGPMEGFGTIGMGVSVGMGMDVDVDMGMGMEVDVDVDMEVDVEVEVEVAMVEPGPGFAPSYHRPQTVVTVIDVADPVAPSILSQTKFDGWQSSSRMIDGMLQLVVTNHQHHYYDIMPMFGQRELDSSTLSVQELLPRFARVGANGVEESGSVLTWSSMYRPADPDGFGVVSVVSMDIDSDAAFSAVGIVAEPGLIYSSTEALYLTDAQWSFSGDVRETTDIYKLAYIDGTATPVATGSVPGRILNQYSMSEYQGHLRVATTVGPIWSSTAQFIEQRNNVYVLAESNGSLEVIGSVENIAPGEDIKAARFLGRRGYVVTFEQMDPLFTLDLSDPSDPQVIGELEVPGFSTFIVPMDEDHLLAVGQYIPTPGAAWGWWGGNWGVQLSIFDVSDFANPVRSYDLVIGGDTGAHSDALNDPKAFTYFAESGLLALPVSIYGGYGGFVDDLPREVDEPPSDVGEPPSGGDVPPPNVEEPGTTSSPIEFEEFNGLMVYRVSIDEGFAEAGRISTQFDGAYYWSSFTRGVFIEDHVFAVTNNGIRGGSVSELGQPLAELVYGPPAPVEPSFGDTPSGSATPGAGGTDAPGG